MNTVNYELIFMNGVMNNNNYIYIWNMYFYKLSRYILVIQGTT